MMEPVVQICSVCGNRVEDAEKDFDLGSGVCVHCHSPYNGNLMADNHLPTAAQMDAYKDAGIHARHVSTVSTVESELNDEYGNPIWKNRVESWKEKKERKKPVASKAAKHEVQLPTEQQMEQQHKLLQKRASRESKIVKTPKDITEVHRDSKRDDLNAAIFNLSEIETFSAFRCSARVPITSNKTKHPTNQARPIRSRIAINSNHLTLLMVVMSISISTSTRELRPSDHGLINQSDPPSSTDDQMKSFFAVSNSDEAKALPKPTDSRDPEWWKKGDESTRRGRHGGGGSAKKILLITSVVCGIAGVVFLLAAALVFAFRSRIISNNNNNNNNNNSSSSTQMVVK
ncbi:hypothetical protein QQ045_023068 [Rhodiola kirilowii]